MDKKIFETIIGAIVLLVAIGFLVVAYEGGRLDQPSGKDITARFDRIDGLSKGSEVRISGLVIGTVVDQVLDPQTYQAIITMSVDEAVPIPEDSIAEIIGDGLLGSKYVAIVPGGAEEVLDSGDEIRFTQSAISIESLIGKFIFGSAGDENSDQADDDVF